jgi:hypothetical protein
VEWDHALIFCKAVVPVLRAGDFELIPPELGSFIASNRKRSRCMAWEVWANPCWRQLSR